MTAVTDPAAKAEYPRVGVDFTAIFRAESSYVWNTLRRLGVQVRDLEDITHEVFLTVHRRLADYDSTRPVRPWLFGIAYRTAARYRDLARHRREVFDVPAEPVDHAPGIEEQVMAQERRALLLQALDGLDLDQRAIFVMHEIDGCPMPEVALTLAVPLNTAYSRLRLARGHISGALQHAKEEAR